MLRRQVDARPAVAPAAAAAARTGRCRSPGRARARKRRPCAPARCDQHRAARRSCSTCTRCCVEMPAHSRRTGASTYWRGAPAGAAPAAQAGEVVAVQLGVAAARHAPARNDAAASSRRPSSRQQRCRAGVQSAAGAGVDRQRAVEHARAPRAAAPSSASAVAAVAQGLGVVRLLRQRLVQQRQRLLGAGRASGGRRPGWSASTAGPAPAPARAAKLLLGLRAGGRPGSAPGPRGRRPWPVRSVRVHAGCEPGS